MMTFVVVLAVSGSLIFGAAWGLFGKLPKPLEGFLVAMAGGALIVSVVAELVEPAAKDAPLGEVMFFLGLGAVCFVVLDRLVDRYFGSDSGGGLLAAITLDGIPENLALGVALIGAGFAEVAALAGSILLSNLPEAAGGARDMRASGQSRGRAFGLWVATAGILSAAALIGNFALSGVSDMALASIRAFAAGAVTASLATEVFPKAFKEDNKFAGIAVALGLIIAFSLHQM
ncbi:ZIP family metal transporter [Pontivivens nitratireducens]|uniref:Zinc transporter n=1 Tax=Pontivivens nitratireducens TaxID=2758038 RepID=A0A6G7VRE4_9RHOB|nr:zinc transporter [Pontibrevibacter nitratireducens]QIK42581.1 zinc transporter [Pontibrevibacter nitratireducens]